MISLCTPSSSETDPQARKGVQIIPNSALPAEGVDPQRRWAESILPLLLARSNVQVVLWSQLSDELPHEFPNGGLYDADGKAKPTLDLMSDLRKACLQ